MISKQLRVVIVAVAAVVAAGSLGGCVTTSRIPSEHSKLETQANDAYQAKDYSKAATLEQQALAISTAYCKSTKKDCYQVVFNLATLAMYQVLAGDSAAADASVRQALAEADSPFLKQTVYSRAAPAYWRAGNQARAVELGKEGLAAGTKILSLGEAGKAIDAVGYDRAWVDLWLTTSPGGNTSKSLRDAAAIAAKRGWKQEASRLNALAAAIDTVDGGQVKSRETLAEQMDAGRRYAAAGAPEYAKYYLEQAASTRKDQEQNAQDAQERAALEQQYLDIIRRETTRWNSTYQNPRPPVPAQTRSTTASSNASSPSGKRQVRCELPTGRDCQ